MISVIKRFLCIILDNLQRTISSNSSAQKILDQQLKLNEATANEDSECKVIVSKSVFKCP